MAGGGPGCAARLGAGRLGASVGVVGINLHSHGSWAIFPDETLYSLLPHSPASSDKAAAFCRASLTTPDGEPGPAAYQSPHVEAHKPGACVGWMPSDATLGRRGYVGAVTALAWLADTTPQVRRAARAQVRVPTALLILDTPRATPAV